MIAGARTRSSRGIALVAVLVVSSLVAVIAMGLTLVATIGRLVARNHREAAALAAAAEGGIELAARALDTDDWSLVLRGLRVAGGSDGAPGGPRDLAGLVVDLSRETHLLNCARPAGCAAADLAAVTRARPWGANNPHWRLYLYGPVATLTAAQMAPPAYLLVWVADDGRETDGRPDIDGGAAEGRHVLRVRALALGASGARRTADAEVVRVCVDGRPLCQPGIRVQSMRELRHTLP